MKQAVITERERDRIEEAAKLAAYLGSAPRAVQDTVVGFTNVFLEGLLQGIKIGKQASRPAV